MRNKLLFLRRALPQNVGDADLAARVFAGMSRPATRFDQWRRWAEHGCTWLPRVFVCTDETLPANWDLLGDVPVSVLLESAQGGRFTYLCDRPARVVVGEAGGARVLAADGATVLGERAGKPLEAIEGLLRERRAPASEGRPGMTGGFIGAFGYDLVRTWERLPASAPRDVSMPLYALVEPEVLLVFDHETRALAIVVWRAIGGGDAAGLAAAWEDAAIAAESAHARWKRAGRNAASAERPGARSESARAPRPSFTAEEFQAAVRKVQDYIAAGHTYQVNLSLRQSRPVAAPAETIYEALRSVNPSPYMGLLRLPEFQLVCGSPELLVRVTDGRIVSRPIAGTRPRGTFAEHDRALSTELTANEKERAEHLMLVDLIRNDIGRVAEPGSVHVREFMGVERYSHVMHLVSEVDGRLDPRRTWVDVMRSMFPGGTITGCPKFRTMEIIEELEPVGRGFYTGSLGWVGYGGDLEMNIVIRSMLVRDGVAHVQTGAGIVADSVPERELDEVRRKAQALWVALEKVGAAMEARSS